MSLDADVPDPPSLHGPQDPGDYDAVEETEPVGDDYRREEVEGALADGAWVRAFEEWAGNTMLSEAEYEMVADLGLLDSLDFYWNPAAGDYGYQVPALPAARDLPAPYDERFGEGDLDGVAEELDTLARTVTEVLEAGDGVEYETGEDDDAGYGSYDGDEAYGDRDEDT